MKDPATQSSQKHTCGHRSRNSRNRRARRNTRQQPPPPPLSDDKQWPYLSSKCLIGEKTQQVECQTSLQSSQRLLRVALHSEQLQAASCMFLPIPIPIPVDPVNPNDNFSSDLLKNFAFVNTPNGRTICAYDKTMNGYVATSLMEIKALAHPNIRESLLCSARDVGLL